MGQRQIRRGSTAKSKHGFVLDDILDASGKLDAVNMLPNVTVRAHDLMLIPQTLPESTYSVSIADCMNKLEMRVNLF